MKLTGTAKEQFEKWFNTHHVYEHFGLATFKELPPSFQWGVIQDFSDSLGYDLSCVEHSNAFMFLITHKKGTWKEGFDFKTRQEARNAAIEKLNELINQNK